MDGDCVVSLIDERSAVLLTNYKVVPTLQCVYKAKVASGVRKHKARIHGIV